MIESNGKMTNTGTRPVAKNRPMQPDTDFRIFTEEITKLLRNEGDLYNIVDKYHTNCLSIRKRRSKNRKHISILL